MGTEGKGWDYFTKLRKKQRPWVGSTPEVRHSAKSKMKAQAQTAS